MAAKWTIWVQAERPDGTTELVEIGTIERNLSSPHGDGLGLRLAEAKDLLRALQSHISRDQARELSAIERTCVSCGSKRPLHDYRSRQVATLFGQVTLRLPRWRTCVCERTDATRQPATAGRRSPISALMGVRATPELIRIQAELGARLSFRNAAQVMSVLLPTSRAANHTGVRRRLARTAERLQGLDNARTG